MTNFSIFPARFWAYGIISNRLELFPVCLETGAGSVSAQAPNRWFSRIPRPFRCPNSRFATPQSKFSIFLLDYNPQTLFLNCFGTWHSNISTRAGSVLLHCQTRDFRGFWLQKTSWNLLWTSPAIQFRFFRFVSKPGVRFATLLGTIRTVLEVGLVHFWL